MSKTLNATCNAAGLVTIEGKIIPGAVVLSEGKQASAGVALIEEDKVTYVASSATDIKTTIEKLSASVDDISNALSTIAGTLTKIGLGMTGPTTAPPADLATDVTAINAKVTDLAAIKENLDLLKEQLK